MGKPTEAHREVLERASATGLSDREIEKQVPLPQGWVCKARKGGNDSARAELAWEKLAAWLDARQKTETASAPSAAVAAEPQAPGERALTTAEVMRKRRELVAAMRSGTSIEDLDLSIGRLFEGLAEKWIEGSESTRWCQVIETRRKVIDTKLRAQALRAETGPRTIEVVYVQDWRPSFALASSSPPTTDSPPG